MWELKEGLVTTRSEDEGKFSFFVFFLFFSTCRNQNVADVDF